MRPLRIGDTLCAGGRSSDRTEPGDATTESRADDHRHLLDDQLLTRR
jgi:hypothetical protein